MFMSTLSNKINFSTAVCLLEKKLSKKQPTTFNSSWIQKEIPRVFRYVTKHIRTEWGDVDWDKIVAALDLAYQRRWLGEQYISRRRRKVVSFYRNRGEVDIVLKKHQNKLYTFLGTLDENDKQIRDGISTALVRIAQKGNLLAKKELITLMGYLIYDWIEYSPRLSRWKGHTAEALEQLECCINRYRYPATFTGYLFRTLEYVGRGLPPMYSLDEDMPNSNGRKRIDFVVQNSENREIYYSRRYTS